MALLLRPLSVGDILDGAFTLYRRNFASFLAVALIPQVPLIIMWLVLPFLVGGAALDDAALSSVVLLSMPYSLFASALIWTALVHATMQAYLGESTSSGTAIKTGLKYLLPVCVALIVVFIAIFIGMFLLVIPAFIFMAMFFAVLHAIVIEQRGPFAALGRSRQLSRGARMRILGVSLLAWLITVLPSLAFGVMAGAAGGLGAVFGGADAIALAGWVGGVAQAGALLIGALTIPFSVGVLTLLYVDRRARTEAPDLEAAAERLSTMS